MKINQIVDEQMKEFDEKFVLDLTEVFFGKREKLREQGWEVGDNGSKILKQSLTPDQVKSFIHSYTRKLIESVAEEIIGEDETEAGQIARDEKLGVQTYYVITANMKRRNQLRAEQRLKVKEIISKLEK